jgi:excisionase family DNA binding protein
MNFTDDQDLLTEREAAELLRISTRHLQRLIENRQGPPRVKLGRRVLYPRPTLLAWLDRQIEPVV